MDLRFPLLQFSQGLINVAKTEEPLTTCSAVALRNGWFKSQLLVDSNGRAVRIQGAKKLHIIWHHWKSMIFLNPIMRVELTFVGEPFSMPINEVRKRVLSSFEKWHGWSTRGDFEELQKSIESAQSISEIIQLLME